jgi:hypothetical protein
MTRLLGINLQSLLNNYNREFGQKIRGRRRNLPTVVDSKNKFEDIAHPSASSYRSSCSSVQPESSYFVSVRNNNNCKLAAYDINNRFVVSQDNVTNDVHKLNRGKKDGNILLSF